MTPTERMARVRALRAEARAWRRAAEDPDLSLHGIRSLVIGRPIKHDPRGAYVRYMMHSYGGSFLAFKYGDASLPMFSFGGDDNARVLACLLLALECEDEAKEVGR